MRRGTTRKAVSIPSSTFARLEAYLEEVAPPSTTKSGFLEGLLVEAHPSVFGDDAPPPPPLSDREKELTATRQRKARAAVDKKKDEVTEFFPALAGKGTTSKNRRDQPLAHLQPKPESVEKPEKDPNDFPTGVIMF